MSHCKCKYNLKLLKMNSCVNEQLKRIAVKLNEN